VYVTNATTTTTNQPPLWHLINSNVTVIVVLDHWLGVMRRDCFALLQRLSTMHSKNGSSLSVDQQLCRREQPKVLRTFHGQYGFDCSGLNMWYWLLITPFVWCGLMAQWFTVSDLRLEIAGSIPAAALFECDLGQVAYTYLPPSPSSIIWYSGISWGSKQAHIATHWPRVYGLAALVGVWLWGL